MEEEDPLRPGKRPDMIRCILAAKWRAGLSPCRLQGRNEYSCGYTLAELLIAMATLGIIAAVAIPSYIDYRERAQIAVAIADIHTLGKDIASYEFSNAALPNSLADIGRASLPDPWGHSYQYLKIAGSKNIGKARKDHFLVPLNSDYDLYSSGQDGDSTAPLSAPQSQDDIIRANDGGYVGLASNY